MPVALPSLATLPAARTLVADPPWDFDDHLPGRSRGAARNYACLSLAQLQAYPIPRMERDAWLLLWYTTAFHCEAELLVEAWGFERTGAELTWVKTTADGPFIRDPLTTDVCTGARTAYELEARLRLDLDGVPRLAFGMGRTTRNCDERVIIARRGRPARASASVRSVFFAPIPRHQVTGKLWHSAKPDRFYALAEELTGSGPRVELFARRRRDGWIPLGDQVIP